MARSNGVSFSIVMPSLNEGTMLAMTVESIARETQDVPYEILVVDDGSTDGSTRAFMGRQHGSLRLIRAGGLGVARARNLGASRARGEYLVFMDAHCRVSPGWLKSFAEALSIEDVGLAGPCFTKLQTPTPRGCGMYWADYALEPCWFEPLDAGPSYPVPLTTGACQAFRRDTFYALGCYDDGFTRWGFEDVELCLRTWLFGYQVVVHPGVTIAHYFRESRDNYDVDDLKITYNFLRMIYLHFSPTRIQRVLVAMKSHPHIAAAQELLAESDVFDRRARMLANRVRDDEWFFRDVNRALAPLEHEDSVHNRF